MNNIINTTIAAIFVLTAGISLQLEATSSEFHVDSFFEVEAISTGDNSYLLSIDGMGDYAIDSDLYHGTVFPLEEGSRVEVIPQDDGSLMFHIRLEDHQSIEVDIDSETHSATAVRRFAVV